MAPVSPLEQPPADPGPVPDPTKTHSTTRSPSPRGRPARLIHWCSFRLQFLVLLAFSQVALGEQRFPPPDFESGYKIPTTLEPLPRRLPLLYADAAVLALTLGAATWLIYRKRSRKGIIGLSLFSLAYFGFYREGCICAIGSVQNVALGVFGNGYAVPLTVMVFFALPLLLALFAGRAFCAGACPHGALQDLVLIKPLPLPAWLEHGLGVLPFIYLGAGVLFAATGSAFIICQYDPFVPIFRMSGRTLMVLTGIALLVLGMFVGRPYCRFLCPYGALLKLASTVAKWRVRVTPDYCTQCRLCEASCPFGAMRQPEAGKPSPATAGRERTQLALLVAALPLLVILGAWVGYRFSTTAAGMHPTVSLARQYVRERDTPQKTGALTPDELALERARQNPEPLLAEALNVENRFRPATSAFGGWIGLVLGSKLISLSVRRKRTDYEPDRGDCFACARCFEYCPNELVRRGFVPAQPISAAKRGSPATAELASEGK